MVHHNPPEEIKAIINNVCQQDKLKDARSRTIWYQLVIVDSNSDDEKDHYDDKDLHNGTFGFPDATLFVMALIPEMIIVKILVAILIVMVLLIKSRWGDNRC